MKALFVFAHPDDESFASGGTIAQMTKEGVDVKLVTLTKGEAGQLGDPPVCNREDLGKVREKELKKAAKILGISKIYFSGFIDGTLLRQKTKKISVKILQILNHEKPNIVITHNKDGGSRHPDHIKTSKAATEAFRTYLKTAGKHVRLYYTIMARSIIKKLEEKGMVYNAFGKIKGTRDSEITTIIEIADTIDQKIKASKCHLSQKKDRQRLLKRREYFDNDIECFKLVLENGIN